MAILAAISFESLLDVLWVAVGLGLVIFFHELGHFAVAKWCDVNVERFSIGFGPILFSLKKGETEYAFSAIPFGGYVKMLGQDDMDPSQLTSEEIAEDPRSYSAKPVRQRMAIISAGVIMNVISGLLFFAAAFGMGVASTPAVLGGVQIGFPAWEAGMRYGDRLTRINDREITSFGDVMRGVALTTGKVTIEGIHGNGETFKVTLVPNTSGTRRIIGAVPTFGLTLVDAPGSEKISPVFPATSAAKAEPAFQPGDVIRKVGDTAVSSYGELQDILAAKRAETLDFRVRRKRKSEDTLITVRVEPTRFRSLGLWVDIGQIAAVRKDSPAAKAGILVGDKITKINGKLVGTTINALKLSDYFASLSGQEVMLEVKRQVDGEPKEMLISLIPTDQQGWVERPLSPGIPLSVPSAGFAYHLIPTVLKVDEGSPAHKQKILPAERIKKMVLGLPPGQTPDVYSDKKITIEFDKKDKNGELLMNWAYAFWKLQELPSRTVTLTVTDKLGKPRRVEIEPQQATDWYVPDVRGVRLAGLAETKRAESFVQSIGMGIRHTRNSIIDIYLTLRNLFGGELSYKELHGPIGIATVAFKIARQGIAELLLFLGFLSVNLAVLNFLPIPVLDGGHMVFLIWEGVTRKRPSERVLVAATYFGLAFVLGLMILVVYLDIFEHGIP